MGKILSKMRLKNISIGFFILIGCFLMTILGLKILFNPNNLEKVFNSLTNLNLEIEKPNINVDYKLNVYLKASNITVSSKDKKSKFIEIQSLNCAFKPILFIFNKVDVKKMNAKSIDIKISRNNKGEIDILKTFKKEDLNKFLNYALNKKYSISRLNFNVENINLNYKDDFKIKSETNLNFNKTDLKISKNRIIFNQKGKISTSIFNKKQSSNIDITLNTKRPFENKEDAYINVDIDNINLYIFSDLFNKYISNDISSVMGNVKVSILNQTFFIETKDLKIKYKDNTDIIPFEKSLILKGLFNYKKNLLEIEKTNLNANDIDIQLKGLIKNLNSNFKNTDYNFDIIFKNTQIYNLVHFLPDNLMYYNLQGIPTLKKAGFMGLLDGKIKISSKMKPACVEGFLKASDVRKKDYIKPYRPNDVNMRFMKDKVRVYTRVYTFKNEYVTIDGVSNLDDSLYGEYSVTSTKNIDLSYAKTYLVPIQKIVGFNIGPVPIMELEGLGNIDIKTKGTLTDAHVFGEFEAFKASASIQGLDAKLNQGYAKLIFDDRNLFFKEIKGKLLNGDFLLTGKGDTKGNVDIDILINNINASKGFNVLKTSNMSKPYSKYFNNISALSNNIDLKINLKGNNLLNDFDKDDFLEKLIPTGSVNFKNNKVILNNSMFVKNLFGNFEFGNEQNASLNFKIGNSQNSNFEVKFNSKTPLDKIVQNNNFEFNCFIKSQKAEFKDVIDEIKFLDPNLNKLKDINFLFKLDTKHQGKIDLNKFDLSSIKSFGYIIGLNSSKCPNIKFLSGLIKLENDKIDFNNFETKINDGNIKAYGTILHFLSKKPDGNLTVLLNNIKLDSIIESISKIKLSQTTLNKGKIQFKGDRLRLNSFSIDSNNMPIYVDSNIRNIFDKNIFIETHFSALLNETTTDNIINPYLNYPVKIKGEMPIKGVFKGNLDNYDVDFNLILPIDTDIFFSGANLGDTDIKKEIFGKLKIEKNKLKVNDLKLIKYIQNQNNRTNPLTTLKASGELIQQNNNIYYNNFKIATLSPINVRILNLIFKKSLLKKGTFECAINLKGDSKLPKVTGKIFLDDLDIPLYDTQINDIKVDISNNNIIGRIDAKNLDSDVIINFNALNKLNAPYIINNIDIQSNKLNISQILNNLTPQTVKTDINKKQDFSVKPEDVLVKKGTFSFKDVNYEKITAKDLKGSFDYKDNIFNLKNIIFDIAQGSIVASGTYNIKNTKLNLNAQMKNCDSSILASDFLKMQGQIFGKVNGSMTLSAKNLNSPDGIKTLKSNVDFEINNGKMPKLGSLEYLLQAGSLFKNGILGLSLNNILQVLTPYKTGEFEKIKGSLVIKGGEVQNLEILSLGKNLSLYLEGSYSILENFADIDIYGKLSKNVSNALDKVTNASIKQFLNSISIKKNKNQSEIEKKFNKIPSLNDEDNNTQKKSYFMAKVLGDINKDNYIKSFSFE